MADIKDILEQLSGDKDAQEEAKKYAGLIDKSEADDSDLLEDLAQEDPEDKDEDEEPKEESEKEDEEEAEDLSLGQISSAELAKFQALPASKKTQVAALVTKVRYWQDKGDVARANTYQRQVDQLMAQDALRPQRFIMRHVDTGNKRYEIYDTEGRAVSSGDKFYYKTELDRGNAYTQAKARMQELNSGQASDEDDDDDDAPEQTKVSEADLKKVRGLIDEDEDDTEAEDAMATDPPVSEYMRRVLFAARDGKSPIGVPEW